MKTTLILIAFAATIFVVSADFQPANGWKPPHQQPPRYINRPSLPKPPRFRREASPQDRGSVSVTRTQHLSGPERRPSYNVDYNHNIWKGRNGEITASGGAQKSPGQRWEPHVGVQGTWRFKREASPEDHGSVSATRTQPLDGPERRPSYNFDYNHNIYKGRDGEITATGGAQKLPGQRWEPHVGVQATWRYKREASPQDRGSVSVTRTQHLSGPERRPSYNVDYNHNIYKGRNGEITASGGAQKLPGQRWEPHVGVQGTWRFKREANPQDHGSVSATRTQSLGGPERRPSYNVDYNHNIYKGKNGEITASGGAQKSPGQRWEPHVGVQGTWRFKREANPQDHGSVSATRTQQLDGPERRPSYNVDYNHNIYKGKNGEITASGGAQKSPGQRWEPHVGVQGTWRFKREASPEDHGSVSATRTQPLDGPERRPSYNFDYNHNIYKGRDGEITATGGAQKLPGQRWEPHVGVQATWRYKREANPGDHGSISITQTKPLSGPERRPSYNVDYQHNIFQHKQGQITAGGGAQKLPGQRWEPTIGVQGKWRF